MKTPNLNLYPPGGYSYEDPTAGVLTGGNWPEVILKLRDFRRRSRQPIGKPEVDVFTQFCERNPEYCRPSAAPGTDQLGVAVEVRDVPFPRRVLNWVAATFTRINRGKLPFVSQEEAYRRANICANCPHQSVWNTLCSGCNKNIHLLVDEVMKDRKETAVCRGLQGCTVHNEDVRLAVHLDQPESQNPTKPGFCWR